MLHECQVKTAINKSVDKKFGGLQSKAAQKVGVRNSVLSRYKKLGQNGWNSRKRWPSLKTLIKIKHVLGKETYEALLAAANKKFRPKHKKK